ncbi:sensor histidine kinase [Anaerophaga thermohalophila]|jgi:signal transduction histidine kinase|uniref:sensor histidine kinase n=1 Tax=Anaerophaga thermohalophila TaxID=177400 RepID=UPI0005C64BEE|nr:ATP-binding protein [Anaerophaga thermohalophila]
MNLITRIVKFLSPRRKFSCSANPSGFFASEDASELIRSLNSDIPESKIISSIDTLALKISKTSQAEYVLIARLTQEQKFQVEAFSHTSKIDQQKKSLQFETKLLSSLLQNNTVHSNDPAEILSSLGTTKHHAKSVTAMLLKNSEGVSLGAIFIFSKKKQPTLTTINSLQFFSFFAASELRHLISKEKMEKKNKELLRTEEELKLKNQLLDNLNKNISKAKQVVDESSRLKSAFLANLSHEIRTPMNVIMGFTELLSAENMSAEQRRHYIDIIQQNGTRLLHIMDSLIDISRFQAKNIGKEQKAFSLNHIMKQLHNNYLSEISITGKPLNLRITLGEPDGKDIVSLDKEATYKVLNHLLDNAVKFTASGYVHFGYEIREKHILFFVEDSGIGIPEGKENVIFDLFRQGDLRLSRQFGGTGLGLAIAKRYVSAMNGQIWCHNNENERCGATFKFTLPCHPEVKKETTSDDKDQGTKRNSGSMRQLQFSASSKPGNQ